MANILEYGMPKKRLSLTKTEGSAPIGALLVDMRKSDKKRDSFLCKTENCKKFQKSIDLFQKKRIIETTKY